MQGGKEGSLRSRRAWRPLRLARLAPSVWNLEKGSRRGPDGRRTCRRIGLVDPEGGEACGVIQLTHSLRDGVSKLTCPKGGGLRSFK